MATAEEPGSHEELAVGTMVGEYRVDALLGAGGFGSVYRATHPIIGKTAAIKVLRREFSANAEMVSRFISEARSVNQIRHKNIIDIFAFGSLPDGRQYYIMELLDGVTLEGHAKSRGGRLGVAEALAILRPLARALHAAHTHGIAHRDIKPENVLLTLGEEGDPIPKLLDFGIAKLLDNRAGQHRTQPGMPMGTPAYMAPEQVHGKDTDHRTDIYSFGVLVFEVLAGELPFDGHSALDLMVKQANAPIPKMSSVCEEINPELDEPVVHMMQKDPADRPASLLEAMDALVLAAERAGIVPLEKFPKLVVPDGPVLGDSPTVVAGSSGGFDRPPTFSGTERTAGTPTRRSWVIAGIVGVAAVAAGIALVFSISTTGAKTQGDAPRDPADTRQPTASGSASAAVTVSPGPSVGPVTSDAVSAPTEPVVSATISVTIVSSPPDAEVMLGKKSLGKTGAKLELPRGTDEVKLVVVRRGFAPKILTIKPDHDIEERVTLVPTKKEYTWD